MQTNVARSIQPAFTHEGARAFPHVTPMQQLRRSVLSCLLFEGEFYEDGKSVADRISEYASKVPADQLAALIVEARSEHNLRHVPLHLLLSLVKMGGGKLVGDTVAATIQRADELSELLSMYWKEGRRPIAKQLKRGLGEAFTKFSAYDLAKYDRAKAIRLRDVLFMTHPKPRDEAQAATWKALVDGTLPAPDTWEVALSSGADKRETWERMLSEGSLGYLALLRNLRNMVEVGVNTDLIRSAILARKGAHRVLPFRYVAAARACPQLEPVIDESLTKTIADLPKLEGRTVVLVDVSGSMNVRLSGKSELSRLDAAAALASLINGDVRMFSFSQRLVEVPPRRGMAGVDAIRKSQTHSSTELMAAVRKINESVPYDRIIVISDEQAASDKDRLPDPKGIGYMINVASNRNGVGYGKWKHIDGFSENVIRWIVESEKLFNG